jgi:poly(3-hydroxyalkanoate) synthetase
MRQTYQGNTVIFEDEYFVLNRFSEGEGTPCFIVPPFAGRDGTVTQNLINKCVEAGRSTYAYELKSATQETKNLSINGLITILDACCDMIYGETGEQSVDLIGCCQGGWLASMFTALRPEWVNRLAVFAAPINTHSGSKNRIEEYCETISLPAHRLIVGLNNGVQPGMAQWLAFAAMAPEQIFFGRYLDLLAHIVSGRDADIDKWEKQNGWYDSPNDLAGIWFLDALENHFCKNALYNGAWEVGGSIVDLRNVTCPVFVFAGEDDDITSVEQARGLIDKVSSEWDLVVFPNCGHTKCFTGSKELEQFAELFFQEE